MKKAYLSIGFQNRTLLNTEIEVMQQTLSQLDIDLFIFVDKYRFGADEEKEMMQTAFHEIDTCGLLLAEVSEKAIGVGIEIGYAVGRQIPVIYLRKTSAEHSTTAAGSAGAVIIYSDSNELSGKLRKQIQSIQTTGHSL